MQIRLPLADRELALEALPARIFTSGTNAGYVEVQLESDEPLPLHRLYEGLRLHIPGELDLLRPTAHESTGTRVVFTFFSAEVSNSSRLPHAVGLVWRENGERPVAPLAFEEAGPERLRELDGEPDLPEHTKNEVDQA